MTVFSRAVVVAVAAMLCAGLAGAATISFPCQPFPVTFDDGVGGPTSVTCDAPAGVPVGSILNSVIVGYVGDYQFGLETGNVVNVTFEPQVTGMPAGSQWSPVSTTLMVTGTTSSGIPAPTGSASLNAAGIEHAFANGFDVWVSSAVANGVVATSSGAVSVTYNYTETEVIPEPASFALLGGGLIALAVFARRRRLS